MIIKESILVNKVKREENKMTDKDLRIILSTNLKKFRIQHNYTQAKFAEMIDISIPFLSDIENGKKWISPATFAKMAVALEIEAYELLKPEKKLPDNVGKILKEYTAEIHNEVGKVIEKLYTFYISKWYHEIR